jgi:hypothetical protein
MPIVNRSQNTAFQAGRSSRIGRRHHHRAKWKTCCADHRADADKTGDPVWVTKGKIQVAKDFDAPLTDEGSPRSTDDNATTPEYPRVSLVGDGQ